MKTFCLSETLDCHRHVMPRPLISSRVWARALILDVTSPGRPLVPGNRARIHFWLHILGINTPDRD